MTISTIELEQHLRSKFNVKIIQDLGELSTAPNTLFKLLDSVYQEKYDLDDRLVFYTSYLPTEKFLKHFIETIDFIDISHWFVLICAPKELEQTIISLCQQHSKDLVPFQFQAINLAPTKPIEDCFSLPDTICAIPWINLEITQQGNITPCCVSNLNLGNVKTTKLEQAFYDDALQKLRNSFLAGERPPECNGCWKVEEKNLTSIRMHNIKRLKKQFLTTYFDQPQLSTLDIKFNNTCNFKCRICSSNSSSLFAAEEHKYLNKPMVIQDNWS